MKLHSHNRLVDTNINSEAVDFGIDAEDAQGLTILLRDTLYEDKVLAPIREYIANAFDANAETGAEAIHVVLPTNDHPQIAVQDFGPGLTEEEVLKIFTRYGKSTKRDSNNVTGCFGIGSKSYAAYTDKATLESTKNGVKNTYTMYLDQNQKAMIKHVSKQIEGIDYIPHENAKSGVRITWGIELSDVSTVRNKFFTLLKYWDPEEYKVKVFEKSYDDADKVSYKDVDVSEYYAKYSIDCDEFKIESNVESGQRKWNYARSRYENNEPKIIMGPITYPLKVNTIESSLTEKQKAFLQTGGLVLKVCLGTVSVAASREGLSYDSVTKAAIISKVESCLSVYENMITEQIANCSSWLDAYMTAQQIRQSLCRELSENMEFRYKSFPLKWDLTVDYDLDYTKYQKEHVKLDSYFLHQTRTSNIVLKKDKITRFNADTKKIFIICDANKIQPHQAARKIKYYLLNQWDLYKSSKYNDNLKTFEAYAIWLNSPKTIHARPLANAQNASNGDTVPHMVTLTELPKWFDDLTKVQCHDIVVPKNHRVNVGNKSKPKKILNIDLDQNTWRGAISARPDDYDLESNLCTIITSHYKPSLQDLKNKEFKKINKKCVYNRHCWLGSPKLIKELFEQLDDKFTVMPIRASQLKDKDIKHLPTIADIGAMWAVSHMLSLTKEEATALSVDISMAYYEITNAGWITRLLFGCKNFYSHYGEYFSNIQDGSWNLYNQSDKEVMDIIKNRHPLIKSASIKKDITNLLNTYQFILDVQSNPKTILALKILRSVGLYKYYKDMKDTVELDLDETRKDAVAFLCKTHKNNPFQKAFNKLKSLPKRFPLLKLIHVSDSGYYTPTNYNLDDYKEYIDNDTDIRGGASSDILIAYLNREIR